MGAPAWLTCHNGEGRAGVDTTLNLGADKAEVFDVEEGATSLTGDGGASRSAAKGGGASSSTSATFRRFPSATGGSSDSSYTDPTL